ncbi:MAG: S-layer homology domain-containing protein [Deltaproteobacteria bacterium]|nr:S-layer homology domain-containing protein [Deltaproteobacteria bacterium]
MPSQTLQKRPAQQSTSSDTASSSLAPNPLLERAAQYGNQMMNWFNQDQETSQAPAAEQEPLPPESVTGFATRYALAREILGMKVGTPGQEVGNAAADRGIFSDRNNLRLDSPVTRAEASKMISVALGIAPIALGEIRRVFGDMPVSHWAAPAVYGLVKVGVLQGYGNDTFNPDGFLEAAHVVGVVAKAKSPPGVPAEAAFDPTVEWGERSIIEGSSRSYSRDDKDDLKRDMGGTEEEKVAAANAIVDGLDVENDKRYRNFVNESGSLTTFCNVFAHDYAFLMGAFLPRLWWNAATLKRYESTKTFPEPIYGENTHEMTANALYDWLGEWGPKYGWSKIGETDAAGSTAAQDAANRGMVVIIAADTGSRASGHVTAVVPETEEDAAKRNEQGQVTVPLQSQAGAANEERGTSAGDWWNKHQRGYPGGKAIYVHA